MNYFLSLINAAAIYGAMAALQSLLFNRLGMAFAALPVFVGLFAYSLAAWSIGWTVGAGLLTLAIGLGLGMAVLANFLPKDHYLLCTLAVLECLAAVIGSSNTLGAREGLSVADRWELGGPGFETSMLPWTVGAFLALLVAIRLVLNSPAGIAIDRLREHPETAARFLPSAWLRSIVIGASATIAMMLGAIYLAYHGRVSPSIFSLDFALLVLTFSVMAYRIPELAGVAALLYWALPYGLTKVLPLSQRGAAELIRFSWGLVLVLVVVVPAILRERRQLRGGRSS